MKLYYADIRGADEAQAIYPPLSGSLGSAFGVSLLAVAYADYIGGKFPRIQKMLAGKPFFPDNPNLHFSISHSKTHVLCALSRTPVGVDTQNHRAINPDTVKKLCTPEELSNLDFFDIWTLRESLFKLIGEGDLRTMRFYMKDGNIIAPEKNVKCHLYDDIEGSSTAACTIEGEFPDKIIKIPIEKLIKPPEKQPKTILNIKRK